MASQMMQPQIILLKEGTDSSQGTAQIVSNINACVAISDVVRTTLGPRGMDKLIYTQQGITISNDGATIMDLLEVVHPAAQILVQISKSQDNEVGDGTTTVVLLAGEFLRESKAFIEEGIHPRNLIKTFREAGHLVSERLKSLAIDLTKVNENDLKEYLQKCAETTLSSKLISGEKEFFSKMVVDAVSSLDRQRLDLKLIGIKKVQGGSMRESLLIDGVAFQKTFSYAGFEQQPKSFNKPKILLLNIELELKAEKENAEVRIEDPAKYQEIIDAEWNIIYEKLDSCIDSGAKIVLSRLAIGDLATQYFADRDVFCAGRVTSDDLERVSKATGAQIVTTVNKLDQKVLGFCGQFEEKQIGNERYNLFTACPTAKTATIILRGGSEAFLNETDRSLHDAIMIVRRTLKDPQVVPGGGAIDMELSKDLRMHARSIAGKQQLFFSSYAKALEVIPRQLCDNAGFDTTEVLTKLRQAHAKPQGEGRNLGIDINSGSVINTYDNFIWEPVLVKLNAVQAATEAACLILSVDETVRNPKAEQPDGQGAQAAMQGRRMPRPKGRGMRR